MEDKSLVRVEKVESKYYGSCTACGNKGKYIYRILLGSDVEVRLCKEHASQLGSVIEYIKENERWNS